MHCKDTGHVIYTVWIESFLHKKPDRTLKLDLRPDCARFASHRQPRSASRGRASSVSEMQSHVVSRSSGVASSSPRCSIPQWHPVLRQQPVRCKSQHSQAAAAAASAHIHAGPIAAAAGVVSTSESATLQRQPASTVRRMILLRHADSETSANLRDYDRPISMQGKREAAKIAAQLSELGWVPDLIIASNSKRTKQTLDTMVLSAAELELVSSRLQSTWVEMASIRPVVHSYAIQNSAETGTFDSIQRCLSEL